MSADELAAFMTPQDKAEVGAGAEDEAARAEEEYWRLCREEVECIRQLRALHPNTAQLAMSADEITEYYQRATLSPRSEAQRERDRKFVSRLQPGPKAQQSGERPDKYRLFKQECVEFCRGDMKRARTRFFDLGPRRLKVGDHTVRTEWSRLKREGLPYSKVETFPWIHTPEFLLARGRVDWPWASDHLGYWNALAFDRWTERRIGTAGMRAAGASGN